MPWNVYTLTEFLLLSLSLLTSLSFTSDFLSCRRWDTLPTMSDIELPSDLLSPLTTLSAHLSMLSPNLPWASLTTVYKAIVDHLTNHIAQRAVYAGWSKFTQVGGEEFGEEVKAWQEASLAGLLASSSSSSAGKVTTKARMSEKMVRRAWRRLEEMAGLLGMEDIRLAAVRDVLLTADEGSWEGTRKGLALQVLGGTGGQGGPREVEDILKRRVDWGSTY